MQYGPHFQFNILYNWGDAFLSTWMSNLCIQCLFLLRGGEVWQRRNFNAAITGNCWSRVLLSRSRDDASNARNIILANEVIVFARVAIAKCLIDYSSVSIDVGRNSSALSDDIPMKEPWSWARLHRHSSVSISLTNVVFLKLRRSTDGWKKTCIDCRSKIRLVVAYHPTI